MNKISNDELDEFMAVRVMEWKPTGIDSETHRLCRHEFYMDKRKYIDTDTWRPSTDLNQAMKCVEK